MTAPTLTPHIVATDLVTADPHRIYVDRRGDGTVLLHVDRDNVPDWEDLTQADVDWQTRGLDENTVRWLYTRYLLGQFGDRMIALDGRQVADLGDLLRAGGAS
jgi:hypothetical protein